MHGVDNNTRIAKPDSPIRQVQLERTSSCISAGRSVAVTDQEEKDRPSFQYFTVLSSSMIFSRLRLRDIVSLERVCTRLRNGIHQDNALAKAWYRRFPSPHQYQLRTAINTKNADQLRDWLKSFTNDQALVNSLADRKPERVYVPALFFFTKTKLMSECKTFKLVKTATIDEKIPVKSARFSVDGRYLVTASCDDTAKIYLHKGAGTWEVIVIIPRVNSAALSPDGHHVVTASNDGTAKIYRLTDDGFPEPLVSISHTDRVYSATFSPIGLLTNDFRCFVIAGSHHMTAIRAESG
ncbi:F-box/WD40 repeat-containing protein [Endozoicomonas sp. SESOKO4]|uniref:F-box/WD repeat-containing protein n=1 Tax=Endozoicomonas sp. SESOKO4 TaxID=2828745 RepID=UPI002149936A|nr:F-box/WD40 repeat-containing protein [Endozoicomonas sp. SESOKO4]